MSSLYIGLISGTSMDGIDAGLFEIDGDTCSSRSAHCSAYPPALQQDLVKAIRYPAGCTVDTIGKLDTWVGECFAEAALRLVEQSGVDAGLVRAIGSHGQTLRHQPRVKHPFTLQIGDPNIIAARTGLVTVADFRRRDLALGGEGAPLASAFHRRFLGLPGEARVVLNIGGFANATVLPARNDPVTGFDTGPGNLLMDAWAREKTGQPYDALGAWADSGQVLEDLLEILLQDPYFRLPPPKSTGFEYFNLEWLRECLPARRLAAARDEDVQATLAALTARTIADAVRTHAPGTARLLVCGGGVHNDGLLRRLAQELAPVTVESTAAHGVDPDWVEAATFAWLAQRCLDGEPGNLPAVTGASRATVLGGVWSP